MPKASKVTKKKNDQVFAKYLIYAAYLAIAFLVLTAFQALLGAIFTSFSGTGAWSLFITIRLLLIMLALGCTLVFFLYLILYALKDESK